MWKAGIEFVHASGNNVPTGYIWFSFSSQDMLDEFINISLSYGSPDEDDEEMYRRATGYDNALDAWLYNINIVNTREYSDDTSMESSLSVRFPYDDCGRVCEKFVEHNK